MSNIRHAHAASPLGTLMYVADGDALTGVYFPGHRYPPRPDRIGEPVDADADPVIGRAVGEMGEYLAGERDAFDVPVATDGDAFSEQVWGMLREIPYGETTTYGALAERLGNRALAQRVGQAVGHNPVSIIIPCHRVVGANGSLTGFAGGLDRKRRLLELEEPVDAHESRLF